MCSHWAAEPPIPAGWLQPCPSPWLWVPSPACGLTVAPGLWLLLLLRALWKSALLLLSDASSVQSDFVLGLGLSTPAVQ